MADTSDPAVTVPVQTIACVCGLVPMIWCYSPSLTLSSVKNNSKNSNNTITLPEPRRWSSYTTDSAHIQEEGLDSKKKSGLTRHLAPSWACVLVVEIDTQRLARLNKIQKMTSFWLLEDGHSSLIDNISFYWLRKSSSFNGNNEETR